MSWDVDPTNPANNHLIVTDIGLHSWEEVNIIHPGGNYGYSEREGNQELISNNTLGPPPSPDTVPLQITGTTTGPTPVTPLYPVAQYSHGQAPGFEGDSISSGYVYRGSKIPMLQGKYIFGEITTGQLFYCDYAEMLAADDGNPATMATINTINLLWDNPADSPDDGVETYTTTISGGTLGPMFHIARAGYVARGGLDTGLPGDASVTGNNGRADIRLQVGEDGELYIISKSDGMVRALVSPGIGADFDQDGDVDGSDFLTWQQNLGAAGDHDSGDADGDGLITADDLQMWRDEFGPPSTRAAAIPEPGSLAMLGLAALALTCQAKTRRSW
jgi:hypothetical protein